MQDMYPPAGFGLTLDAAVRRTDRGRILIGGAPMRIVRLTPRGADTVDSWTDGEPLAESVSHRRLARRLLDAGMVHPRCVAHRPVVVSRTTSRPDLTVVVPVHDNPSGLDRCLAALADLHVLVVDDASSDAVSHRRIAKCHGADYIRREDNGGPGVARNTGLESVRTTLVAFIDSDVEVRPGWHLGLTGHFADPMVAAVAPRIRSRRSSGLLATYERDHSPLDLGCVESPVGPGRVVSYVPTAVLVARTASIQAIGGFDPGLRCGEDVDLVWRLVDGGGVVRYEPSVEAIHEPRSAWPEWLDQRRRYGVSAAALGRRHGRRVAPAGCSRWSAATWALVVGGHPVIGGAVAVGSTAALATKLGSVPRPRVESVRLAGRGHLMAGLGLARAVTRVWWPIALVVAAIRPRRRAAVAAVIVAPAAIDWMRGRRPAGALRSIAVRTVDDMAYGVGVWQGAISHRSLAPILPDLSEWPGRSRAVDDTASERT